MNRADRRRNTASKAGDPAARAFLEASVAHRSGDTDKAERLYRHCLALDPRHVPARHDLGVLLLRGQQPAAAAAELQRVVTLQPSHAHGWLNLGLARSGAGDASAARSAAERAVALDPELAPAQAALGHVLSRSADWPGAAAAFRTAIALDPKALPVRLQYVALLRRMGDGVAALAEAERFVASRPDDPRGHCERGAALAALGRVAEAEQALRLAAGCDAQGYDALRELGTFLVVRGRTGEADAAFAAALARRPESVALHVERARFRRRQADLAGALADLQLAVSLAPPDPQLLFELGDVLFAGAQHEAATAALLEAIALKPDWGEAYGKLVAVRAAIGDVDASLELLQHAVALAPDRLELAVDLLLARLGVCDWRDLEGDFLRTKARCIEAGVPFPPFTLLAFGVAPAEFQLWARAWAERKAPPAPPRMRDQGVAPRPKGARLRVGYLSADFRDHATATLVAELLALHDRGRFEAIGYNIGPLDGSALGRRMVGALDRVADLAALDDAAAAARIAEDDLDILVDLMGYTTGSRVGILAHRPAPIQVNFVGFPGPMGTPLIDYIIADAVVAPREHQAVFDEAIVHLPHCYQPNDRRRPSADPGARRVDHGLPDDGFVFCCFNTNYKIVPLVFDIWMRLLLDLPGSVLWLLHSSDRSVANLRKEAAARGVDAARLVFAPRVAFPRHMARLGLADLFLDTLPVNAHTTASEALWAGLPLLTVLGPTFVSRVAASLLTAMGVPELVMPDLAAYEREAAALARDPARLRALRARIAANREPSPVFDTPRYVRGYEAALTRMVELRDQGRSPEPFAIEDQGRAPDGPAVAAPAPLRGGATADLLAQLDALIDTRTAG